MKFMIMLILMRKVRAIISHSVIKPSHLIIVRSEICAWKNELNTKDSPKSAQRFPRNIKNKRICFQLTISIDRPAVYLLFVCNLNAQPVRLV